MYIYTVYVLVYLCDVSYPKRLKIIHICKRLFSIDILSTSRWFTTIWANCSFMFLYPVVWWSKKPSFSPFQTTQARAFPEISSRSNALAPDWISCNRDFNDSCVYLATKKKEHLIFQIYQFTIWLLMYHLIAKTKKGVTEWPGGRRVPNADPRYTPQALTFTPPISNKTPQSLGWASFTHQNVFGKLQAIDFFSRIFVQKFYLHRFFEGVLDMFITPFPTSPIYLGNSL